MHKLKKPVQLKYTRPKTEAVSIAYTVAYTCIVPSIRASTYGSHKQQSKRHSFKPLHIHFVELLLAVTPSPQTPTIAHTIDSRMPTIRVAQFKTHATEEQHNSPYNWLENSHYIHVCTTYKHDKDSNGTRYKMKCRLREHVQITRLIQEHLRWHRRHHTNEIGNK